MALWKLFRGSRADLDAVEKHDGYVYFCDDGALFFDYTDDNNVLQRKQITVSEAEKISGYDINAILSEIPTSLSELTDDSTHRTVTDEEKRVWNNKSDFSGSFTNLTDKPTTLEGYGITDGIESVNEKTGRHIQLSAEDVGALPNTIIVPTKTSQLENDSRFLTKHQSLEEYAKIENHYTKTESDDKYQLKGNYLTSVPSEYVTLGEMESYVQENTSDVAHYITPEMYGAKGDGVTDDSAAIQSAIDAAINSGGCGATVYMARKKYAISTGLVINTSSSRPINFICYGDIIYSGTGVAITLESSNYSNIEIFSIWAENGTAFKTDSTISEVSMNLVTIRYIRTSKIGLHLLGGGSGTSGHSTFYNKFHIEGGINSTDTCVYIEADTQLVNENYFWLGRLYGGATYGVRINAKDTFGGAAVNGNASRNIFYGGNFEGLSSDGYSVHLHNSSLNVFHDFRTEEAYGKYVVGLSGECYANDIGLSRIALSEVDISALTNSGDFANILRSPQIIAATASSLNGQNKILVTTDGFSSEISDIAKNLQTETWVFTLKDGTIVEKQVTIS